MRQPAFFGAFIGYPLYSIFKNPGAAIICGLLIFLTVMLMTGTTLIALFKAVSKPVKHIEKVAESAYEQRRRPPAEVDIPLDGDQPAEEETDTETIEEKQKKVVTKYRDLDSEETVTNISSNSEKAKKQGTGSAGTGVGRAFGGYKIGRGAHRRGDIKTCR